MKPSNEKVALTGKNIPSHMHHSSITQSTTMETMWADKDTPNGSRLIKNALTYDMFYNDSCATGVDSNELDGVIDEFKVESTGDAFGNDV